MQRTQGGEVHDDGFQVGNDRTVFFTRPVSGAVMAISALALALSAVRAYRDSQREADRERLLQAQRRASPAGSHTG